jgi:hypothetical protein
MRAMQTATAPSNYCSRYRPAARQPRENDLSAAHLGSRTVLNGEAGER